MCCPIRLFSTLLVGFEFFRALEFLDGNFSCFVYKKSIRNSNRFLIKTIASKRKVFNIFHFFFALLQNFTTLKHRMKLKDEHEKMNSLHKSTVTIVTIALMLAKTLL